MSNPEVPNDPGKLVEAGFSDDVEILAALEGMVDDSKLDRDSFSSRVMEAIELEDLFDQD